MSLGNIFIRAQDVNTLYLATLSTLLSEGEEVSPRGMVTHEARAAMLVLDNPLRCLVSIPERKINYHFAVAEWWWIAAGNDSVESISPYCSEIAKFSDDGKTFFGAYGPRWRGQIGQVIRNLRNDNNSRQAVVTIFRPELYRSGIDEQGVGDMGVHVPKDVPCTISMQYFIRNDQLETIVTMRSWDAWLGLPYDVFNFARLGALVAGELGVQQGPLVVQAGSLHVYDRNRVAAEKLIGAPYKDAATKAPELTTLPHLLDAGTMKAWECSARGGYVATTRQPWVDYLKVLADRKAPRQDLDEPFKSLIPMRLDI